MIRTTSAPAKPANGFSVAPLPGAPPTFAGTTPHLGGATTLPEFVGDQVTLRQRHRKLGQSTGSSPSPTQAPSEQVMQAGHFTSPVPFTLKDQGNGITWNMPKGTYVLLHETSCCGGRAVRYAAPEGESYVATATSGCCCCHTTETVKIAAGYNGSQPPEESNKCYSSPTESNNSD